MPNLRLADKLRIDFKKVDKATGGQLSKYANLETEAGRKAYANGVSHFANVIFKAESGMTEKKFADTRLHAQVKAQAIASVSLLDRIPIVVADNVAERYVEKEEEKYGRSPHIITNEDAGAIAQAAPPFVRCFVEWRWPPMGNLAAKEKLAGLLIWAIDLTKSDEEILAAHPVPMVYGSPGVKELLLQQIAEKMKEAPDVRWLLMASGYGVDFEGRATYSKYQQLASITHMGRVNHASSSAVVDNNKEALQDGEHRNIWIALHVFNFLHCRNIECVPVGEYSQTTKWHRRQKLPGIKFYTLKVSDKKRRSEVVTLSDSSQLRAEHICRGHFKEYTEDARLFGKYVGRFWIEQHSRGDKAAGEIRKRYETVN